MFFLKNTQSYARLNEDFHYLQVLNKSFVQLKVDLGGLYTMVTSQANSLANVSHHVQALETFVKLLSQTGMSILSTLKITKTYHD